MNKKFVYQVGNNKKVKKRTYLVFKFTYQQKTLVLPSTNSFKQILVT